MKILRKLEKKLSFWTVTVIDLQGSAGEANLRDYVDGVVSYFVAHANQTINYLAFSPSSGITKAKIFAFLGCMPHAKQSAVFY